MYRNYCWAILASALVACGAEAPTAPPVSFAVANAPDLQVTGSVHFTNPDFFGNPVEVRTLSFTARKNGSGEVSGRFDYHQVFLGNTFKFTGEMTCLTVRGNRAWLGARVLDATNPARIGQFGWWQVTDSGEGANDDADLGGLVGLGSEERNEAYCATQPDDASVVGPFAAKGNVQIR
jgi:hypothetical protein